MTMHRCILFVCGHNAGRSQMAQGYFNKLKHNFPTIASQYVAISMGTRPGIELNPQVIEVMKEEGIDLTDQTTYFPKGVDHALVTKSLGQIKRVIVACDDTCLLPPIVHATPEHWNLPDPYKQPINVVRRIRDLTKGKVITLLEQLERGEVS